MTGAAVGCFEGSPSPAWAPRSVRALGTDVTKGAPCAGREGGTGIGPQEGEKCNFEVRGGAQKGQPLFFKAFFFVVL